MYNKPTVLGFFIKTVPSITCILGLVGYFLNIPSLIIIGFISYIVEVLYTFATGELHGFTMQVIVAFIAGIVAVRKGLPLFYTICCGFFIERSISTAYILVVGIISLIGALIDKLFYR